MARPCYSRALSVPRIRSTYSRVTLSHAETEKSRKMRGRLPELLPKGSAKLQCQTGAEQPAWRSTQKAQQGQGTEAGRQGKPGWPEKGPGRQEQRQVQKSSPRLASQDPK